MLYNSTRGGETGLQASEAILKGLADDGGLFMPESIPALKTSLKDLSRMSYQDVCYEVIKEYLTDFTEEELRHCINSAYDEKFETPAIAPLVKKDDAYFLELFHGKTIAFKDMALSILPHFMVTSARKNNVTDKIVILTATSGDTGKAAMAGFSDVPGTEIIVFYPYGGVSRFQELQMRTEPGKNTHAAAIRGNFDDAQTGVKKIFGDREFTSKLKDKGVILSSANSINIGRLVPQVAYYVYSYAQLLSQGEIEDGEKINVCVPTGNFGNILAAYFAKHMGVPIDRLICASNENRVLTDFFGTGKYDRNRPFILTSSPSMDILISSNLERLIYLSTGRSAEKTSGLMKALREQGVYDITDDMKEFIADFFGGFASEDEVFASIKALKDRTGYVMDPHTAVAKAVYDKYVDKTGDKTKTVIASTASPYKFSPNVMKALGEKYDDEDVFLVIDRLHEISGTPEPKAIKDVRSAEIRHNTVCEVTDMEKTVETFLFG
ncbi:threonine synthase [Oribacterium sp. WCC10]|uniref:threonine synthase n=1 Tax=Oribacterium sp. WCC10 TaxID=1855343 RepID=UPI0008EC9AEE|nr:threonine synthase [Oribacterium sp. WCC10]SFG39802.1 threonine synthase [Oribacterium sp. WCC10]